MRRTYWPARKGPVVPFFLKVGQHFAVEVVLVQQGFDPVGVVLQVLQQHLQVSAQPAAFSTLMLCVRKNSGTFAGTNTYFLYSAFFRSLEMSNS